MLLCGVMLAPAQAQNHRLPAFPLPPRPAKGWTDESPVVPPPPEKPSTIEMRTPATPARGPIRQAALQQPGYQDSDDDNQQTIQLTPPGPEELFQLHSEHATFQRIIEQNEDRGGPKLEFPENVILTRKPYYGRAWPQQQLVAEPNYVCHKRLLFEEMNAERYGWELGIFQPIVSSLAFYKDVILLPYHVGTAPCRWWECSAGKCMPGDPVPYRCFPPELSVSGAALQTLVVGGLLVLFP